VYQHGFGRHFPDSSTIFDELFCVRIMVCDLICCTEWQTTEMRPSMRLFCNHFR